MNDLTSNKVAAELRALADRETGYGSWFNDDDSRLCINAADEIDRLERELRLAISARDYANAMLDASRNPPEAGGLRHSGSCLTDPFANEVCDGMYAEVVDQCLTLQEALTAVYSLAGEDPAIAEICRKAIIETGGEWDGHDSELRRTPVEPGEGWISVTDRLPVWTDDGRKFVLAYSDTHDWGGTQFAVMRQADFHALDIEGDGEPGTYDARVVTHWKELRAPQTKGEGQ